MSLAVALAAAKGVQTIGSYVYNRYKNNKRQKFGDSSYGKELQSIGRNGRLSNQARNNIVGGVARNSANIAQTGKASYAGRLAHQGLEGSVAGQRGLNEFDLQRQRSVSEASRTVDLANEQSKVDARLSFAEQSLQDQRMREGLDKQNMNQLLSGLGETAQLGAQAYFGAKTLNQKLDALSQLSDEDLVQMARGKLIDLDTLTKLLNKGMDDAY